MHRFRNKYINRHRGFAAHIFYSHLSYAHKCQYYELQVQATPGMSFVCKGRILPSCEVFYIELISQRKGKSKQNVLLHMTVLLLQNFIARNTCRKGKWGVEECTSTLPFRLERDGLFHIQLLLTQEEIYIAVNGYHFARYAHRLPFKWLSSIYMRGDITNCDIDYYYVSEYPIRWLTLALPLTIRKFAKKQDILSTPSSIPKEWLHISAPYHLHKHKTPTYQLSLPFYGCIPELHQLIAGSALRIEGRMQLMPQKFSIALQYGQSIWPQPIVSLELACYFKQHRSARIHKHKAFATLRTYIHEHWVNNHVIKLGTTLEPGRAFVIIIFCGNECYELYINGRLFYEFKHHMNPADVDMVNIRGDIRLWYVVIEDTSYNPQEGDDISANFYTNRHKNSTGVATQT